MVYVFRRNKQNGVKKVVQEVDSIEEARKICTEENLNASHTYWYEFTKDFEWTKN